MNLIDKYIAKFPPETQILLQQVRETINAIIPDAVECMSYGIPTFDLNKKHIIHFAGYEKHIGLYPGADGIAHFKEEFKSLKLKFAKGSVQFPINKPMPLNLIKRITEYRLEQHLNIKQL